MIFRHIADRTDGRERFGDSLQWNCDYNCAHRDFISWGDNSKIGRASCRERGEMCGSGELYEYKWGGHLDQWWDWQHRDGECRGCGTAVDCQSLQSDDDCS